MRGYRLFTMEIATNSPAFVANGRGELVRALQEVMDRVGAGDTSGRVMDAHGQSSGMWQLSD